MMAIGRIRVIAPGGHSLFLLVAFFFDYFVGVKGLPYFFSKRFLFSFSGASR